MTNFPKGEISIQLLAMPADTNPFGDIFGGWLISQMDIAGGIFCRKIAKGRFVTVAIDSITFKQPVFVGDILGCHVELIKKGNTSITVHVEAWVSREFEEDDKIKVTEGNFTYVRIDDNRKPLSLSAKGNT